jgi:hypothetical protein
MRKTKVDIEHINHMIKFLGEEISSFKHIKNPETHIHTAAICEARSLFTELKGKYYATKPEEPEDIKLLDVTSVDSKDDGVSSQNVVTTIVTTNNRIFRKDSGYDWYQIVSPLDEIDEDLMRATNLL